MEGRGRARTDAACAGILIIMILIPFLVRAAQGLTALSGPLTHDIALQWIPFRMFIDRSLQDGVFPLWATQVFAGFPFAAFSHTGSFYPLGALLLMGDYAGAVNYFYPLHLCIAGLGVYALCRRAGLFPAASLLAALSYVFAGKPFYFIHFLPATCSNAWMPWFIFSALSILITGRAIHFVLAGMFLSLQVLGGDVESTSYGLMFAIPALALLGRGKRVGGGRWLALLLSMALALLLCSIQALPLAEYSRHFIRNQGVTFEFFSQRRLPLSLIWAVLLPVKGLRAGSAMEVDAPYFYLGLTGVALAILAAVRKAGRSSRGLGLLALLALAWSFGSFGIIDRLQFLLPLLGRFGTPEHAYFMGQLFMALLAGQGFAYLWRDRRDGARGLALVCALALLLFLFGWTRFEFLWPGMIAPILMAVALAAALVSRKLVRGLAPAAVALVFLVQAADLYGLALSHLPANRPDQFGYSPWLEKTARLVRDQNSRYIMVTRQGLNDPELLYHAGMALDMDAVDGWITVPPRGYAEVAALADPRAARFRDDRLDHLGLNAELKDGKFITNTSMPLLDLLSLRYVIDRGLPLKFSSPSYLALVPPEFQRRGVISPAVEKEEEGAGLSIITTQDEVMRFRVFINDGDELIFGLDAEHHDDALGPAAVEARVEALWGESTENVFEAEVETRAAGSGRDERIEQENIIDLDKLAGKEIALVLLTSGPRERKDITMTWKNIAIVNPTMPFQVVGSPSAGILVYENREALARAFVVRRAEVVSERAGLLARMGSASRAELASMVFVERDYPGLDALSGPAGARAFNDTVELVRRRPGEEVYRVTASGPGLLFISDQYYPGWRAYVEGAERRIIRADYNFKAVPVDSGSSIVRFSYAPFGFELGLWLSLTGWILLLFVGWLVISARRRRPHSLNNSL